MLLVKQPLQLQQPQQCIEVQQTLQMSIQQQEQVVTLTLS